LEAVVTAKRDKAAALKLLKRILEKYGCAKTIVTDGLYSQDAAMKEIGIADRQQVGGQINNRVENSHQPFRRRERTMQRSHIVTREVCKHRRSVALAEWRALAA
jgi:putative transposase